MILLLLACRGEAPNVLVVVLDDIGVEQLASYDVPHGDRPHTPVLDELAATSMRFDNAYAMPVCSSTRFSALTGRYGRRVGLGKALQGEDLWEMPETEHTLAEALQPSHRTVAIGKWHLARGRRAETHPRRSGFDVHDGPLGNSGYFDWQRTINGRTSTETDYTSTVFTDAALSQMVREPWFLWVAYNAAHERVVPPPMQLNPEGVDEASTGSEIYRATVEALDTEIGRLLAGTNEETIVVVFGDNGSLEQHIGGGWEPSTGKGSVWESGVRIPLWVRHPAGEVGVHDGLVHIVDLMPTLLDWTGAGTDAELDGLSFAAALEGRDTSREFVYTERFLGFAEPYSLDHRSVRSDRYKLVDRNGDQSFHDLLDRFDDGPAIDPPAEVAAALRARLQR